MKRIDARGLGCPKPVLLAEEALAELQEGMLELLVDNEASVRNLERFARSSGFFAETTRAEGHWVVRILKGYPCELPTEEPPEERKHLLLVVGTDTMGKEEALGRQLMKAFFETMRVNRELPHTIFFLNAGVRLTSTDEEFVPLLREIEQMGVEVYSCGTCLKHYGLEDALKVGRRGSTDLVVGGLREFQKVVWI